MAWKWTTERGLAVTLLAAPGATVDGTAAQLGIADTTVTRWLQVPEFKTAAETERKKIVEEARAAALTIGIADQVNRIQSKDWRRNLLLQIIEERAADAEMKDVPGGTTGLLVHEMKGVGQGPAAMVVDVYRVDTGLLAEIDRLETDVARELGQWIDKSESAVSLSSKVYLDTAMGDV